MNKKTIKEGMAFIWHNYYDKVLACISIIIGSILIAVGLLTGNNWALYVGLAFDGVGLGYALATWSDWH